MIGHCGGRALHVRRDLRLQQVLHLSAGRVGERELSAAAGGGGHRERLCAGRCAGRRSSRLCRCSRASEGGRSVASREWRARVSVRAGVRWSPDQRRRALEQRVGGGAHGAQQQVCQSASDGALKRAARATVRCDAQQLAGVKY